MKTSEQAPVRVLLAHNAYQQRGGEDMVVEAEAALLRQHGHAVELLTRHNDELAGMGRGAAALDTLWSRRTARELRERIEAFRPDVVHVHNTFPLISPSIYWAAAAAGVPVVQTLHNFRLACPQAMFLRDGKVCEDCMARAPLPAIRHGCYRGSRAQTGVLAGMLVLHRALGTWQHKVTRYIALNSFCRDKFIEAGLPAERIVIKPNFVEAPAPGADAPRDGFLFVGRLSHEKGVSTLAEAWRHGGVNVRLAVAGSGPSADLLKNLPGVDMLGALPLAQVQQRMASAAALVLPSIWYENFPRTLVEALGAGLPVIASRIGALASLVSEGRTGLLFEPGNAADLADKLAWAAAHPREMASMGRHARADYEAQFTPERNLAQLLDIYAEARRS
ncbi:MAG: glycosyltransferase family 4 protein [Burkholderiaceae bacterium]|nr:glycosyltransferase family 4 protein [Roseateles sp.]MBV8469801.1 glycosyltransferase family 4 protein [Burkholderiaceae bacterium]